MGAVPTHREDGRHFINPQGVQVGFVDGSMLLSSVQQLTHNTHVCRHLALSTNNIDKISSLAGMDQLKILSLGRNVIKKIENIEAVADTLEELWLSYNQIEKLVSTRRHQQQQQKKEHVPAAPSQQQAWCSAVPIAVHGSSVTAPPSTLLEVARAGHGSIMLE
jgi:hypothetical protein